MNTSPLQGVNNHEINSYDVLADTNDLSVFLDQDFTDNRLSIISSLADDSNLFFRFEGNLCRIFTRGSKQTDVELVEESVTSSVDIEDVYASVEVIGQNGVTSGIVQADDAPDFIDKHKELRERDIKNKEDANRRAMDFLRSHSSIEYSGSITTLPTRVPVGEELPDSIFSHGKRTHIEKASYSKRRTNIDAGKTQSFAKKIISLDRGEKQSEITDTK